VKKRVLIALVVVLALAAAASLVWASSVGLVSYWPFDEGSGPTAFDAVNGNDGTINGATYVPGKFGKALNFAASGDLVTVGNDALLRPAKVTVSDWVRNVGAPTSYDYILAKTLDGGKASYAFYTGGSGGLFFYVSGSTYYLSHDAGSGIWDGGWHHIAGTYDGSSVRLFVDGSEIGTAKPGPLAIVYGTTVFNGDLSIGSYGNQSPALFDWRGEIDEVGIWNRALSAAEVAWLASPEVDIDIKPGSFPNCINPDGKGVIPVAILTTDTFNAASVDPFSVTLEGAAVRVKGKSGNAGSLEDVDSDGDLDLVVHIVDDSPLVGMATATVEGRTVDGLPITGSDSICIVPPE